MYIVAIGWMFVVVCMAAAEGATGAWVGALVTLACYGVLPLGLFLWVVGTPQRHRMRDAKARAARLPVQADATNDGGHDDAR